MPPNSPIIAAQDKREERDERMERRRACGAPQSAGSLLFIREHTVLRVAGLGVVRVGVCTMTRDAFERDVSMHVKQMVPASSVANRSQRTVVNVVHIRHVQVVGRSTRVRVDKARGVKFL